MAALKDLTRGSIVGHLVTIGSPAFVFLLFQGLYFLLDIYFVAPLGEVAIAGVSMGGQVLLVTTSLFQILGIGTTALIANAVGRKDRADAQRVFNQSVALSALCGGCILLVGYALAHSYVQSLTQDAATIAAATTYLYWLLPGLASQFSIVAITAALRATGNPRPMMFAYVASIVLMVLLAPVLISGHVTGHAFGVAGAGLAPSLGNVIIAISLWIYFNRAGQYVSLDRRLLRLDAAQCKRILKIGVPAGSETALMFLHTALLYWTIRRFGPQAQAGFGIGLRVTQVLLVPAVAISFAAGPIAGQNFGAGAAARVRRTFWVAAILATSLMLVGTLLMQLAAAPAVRIFSQQADVVAVAASFLQLTSLAFAARGLTYACSSIFQGISETRPALVSSAAALMAVAIPAIAFSDDPAFRIEHAWYLWIAAATLQAAISLVWLQFELRRRLSPPQLPNQAAAHPAAHSRA